jgi:hypothetical protein
LIWSCLSYITFTFTTETVAMCMIYRHTKFHSGCNGALVSTIKLKAKWRCNAATVLFHVLQKNYLERSFIFFKDLLLYIISGVYMNGASVTVTSQVCTSVMMLLTVGN